MKEKGVEINVGMLRVAHLARARSRLFQQHKSIGGFGEMPTKSRGVKLVYCLRKLALILAKPFPDASRDDVIALVGRLESEKLAETTKYDLKVVLKTFYRWLKGGEDEQLPKEVSWLKPRIRNRSHHAMRPGTVAGFVRIWLPNRRVVVIEGEKR